MATLAEGNVRVGLEDNIWLEKGRLAKNYQLVEKAVDVIENFGCNVMSPKGSTDIEFKKTMNTENLHVGCIGTVLLGLAGLLVC